LVDLVDPWETEPMSQLHGCTASGIGVGVVAEAQANPAEQAVSDVELLG
jgi:hypothetical protein